MKAGTTTLYRDLMENPAIFMPEIKEPGNLQSDDVLCDEGRREYAAHFIDARSDQICGDASTEYSKLPDISGVPGRAGKILDRNLRVIYVVREPVSRIISHHKHEFYANRIRCDIDEAVGAMPRFIDYSRYAMQIEPWIDMLGEDRVRIVVFESYIADRRRTIDSLSEFLGIKPAVEVEDADTAHNSAAGKRMLKGPIAWVQQSFLYQRVFKGVLPRTAKDRIRSMLPKPPNRIAPPSAATVGRVFDELSPDIARLTRIMGHTEPAWDIEAVLRKYGAQSSRASSSSPHAKQR